MEVAAIDEAIELLEKANADLEPELLSVPATRERLKAYVRAQRLAAFGVAALARKLDDVSELAQVTGTSVGRAKETVTTGRILRDSDDVSDALRCGDISLDQAAEIAKPRRLLPARLPNCSRSLRTSPSTCSGRGPERPSSRPSGIKTWQGASATSHGAKGPASNGNLKPRCWRCHQVKTQRDRRAGRLKPPEP